MTKRKVPDGHVDPALEADIAAQQARAAERAKLRAANPKPAKAGKKTVNVAKVKETKAVVTAAQAKAAEKAKVIEAAGKKLEPLAKEVNVRFEKIAKLEGDANDHRLAAALRIAEAEKIAKEAGIKFQTWAAENIKEQGWEAVRKLLYVGRADDPKAALADLRGKTKKAQAKHRDKKKTTQPEKPAQKPVDVVMALKPEDQTKVIKDVAKDLGLAVVSKEDAKAVEQLRRDPPKPADKKPAPAASTEPAGLPAIQAAIGDLKQSDKHKLIRWLAEVLNLEVSERSAEAEKAADDAALTVPDFLRRT